ncbi:MAG: GEVED domain-containing protein [Bacteroidota bacterium]
MNPWRFPVRKSIQFAPYSWLISTSFIGLLLLSLSFSHLLAQPAGFTDQLFLGGWNQVNGFTFDVNGRMFAWEKSGKVWIVDNGVRQSQPLLDISEEVGNWRDFGLVGFALDPNFLSNGHLYLLYIVDRHHLLYFGTSNYNPNTNEYFNATIGRITRYTANASTNFTTVDYNSRKVLVGETKETGMPSLHESHGVGQLVFGTDGTLLATFGDGASYSSVDEGSASETYYQQAITDGIIPASHNIGAYRCQLPASLNGKVIRIDPNTGNGLPSNPNYDSSNPRSAQSRTWSTGIRNAYRITKKPGTGSHIPSDADPGVFYFGDVGWGNREELNVIDAPGLNFGWPKYEGMTYQPGYNNPSYAPASHTRPIMDWRNSTPRALVHGTIYNIGSAEVPGPDFRGNASTGGVFYIGDDFPPEYQNTYFQADYGGNWIKRVGVDEHDHPTYVENFKENGGAIVYVNTHPIEGGIYYVSYPSEIRKISYVGGQNRAPMAMASATPDYGNSPLDVSFTGDQSFDPGFGNLTYLWEFGDGNTSTQVNPTHTYSASGVTPYTVRLTVTDDGGLSDQTELNISLNNLPPQILSTSIDNINTFSPSNGRTLNLSANVNDPNHNNNQLTYQWDVALFHNDHSHAEAPDMNPSTTAVLSPIGCDGATYWYRIQLTVTDPGGLKAIKVKDIFPNCSGQNQSITFNPLPNRLLTDAPFSLSANASSGLPIIFYVMDGPAQVVNNTLTLSGLPGTVTVVATQPGNASYAPAVPVIQSFLVSVPNIGNGQGLEGTYYNNANFTNEAFTRIDPEVDFNWGTGSPDPSMGPNTFSVRWEGEVEALHSEEYTFYFRADDGIRLWVDNQQLINEWQDQAPTTYSGTIDMIGGQRVPIRIEYYENTGGAVAELEWSSASQSRQVVPSNLLYPPVNQQSQTITFPAISDKLTIDAPFAISATASSGLPVSFSIISGPASISGSTITLDGTTGTVVVEASQAGNASYDPALEVRRSFDVNLPPPQTQTITFPAISDKLTTDAPFSISATASSGLPVSFSIISGPASISGNTITLDGTTGTVVVEASQAGNANYDPALDVQRSFAVNTPPVSTPDYCDAGASFPWHEWIANVSFNTIDNSSGKDGYSDYTTISTTVNTGSAYSLSVQHAFSYTQYDEYLRVWIDFNLDGDFEDAGEEVFSDFQTGQSAGTSPDPFTAVIAIPSSASIGNSRMRLALQRDAYADPCESYTYGEVEDYEIIIASGGGGGCVNYQSAGSIEYSGSTSTSASSINPGNITNASSPSGGTGGSAQYRWQKKEGSGNWQTISGANNLTYNPPSLSENTCFRRQARRDCQNAWLSSNQICFTVNVGGGCVNYTDPGSIDYTGATSTTQSSINPGTINSQNTPGGGNGGQQEIQWQRKEGNGNWQIISGANNLSYNPPNLTVNTCFRRQARRDCQSAWVVSNQICFTVNASGGGGMPTGYCNSLGQQPWQEWIGLVTMGNIDNSSAKSQYSDFTSQSTNVDAGGSYSIAISPAFSYTQYDEYFRVWVDFNRDGDFEDAGEEAFSAIRNAGVGGSAPNPVTGTIAVPSNASQGTTRMRISMKRDAYADPCESFTYGEVEDYALVIGNGGGGGCVNYNSAGSIDYSGTTTTTDPDINPGQINNDNSPSGGSGGSRELRWQRKEGSGAWQTIANANGLAYNPPLLSTNTCFRRQARRDCQSAWLSSNEICFVVNAGGGTGPSTNLSTSNTTVSGAFIVDVTFSSAVSGFALSDIIINNGNATNLSGSGANYSFTATPVAEGAVSLSIPADVATDGSGNGNLASGVLTVNYTTGGGGPTGYCQARGLQPWFEWIGNVSFGAIDNNSAKDGYADYTALSTDVVAGSDYPISITPVFSYTHFEEYVRVWIDANADGDFDDAGERVFAEIKTAGTNGTAASPITGTITIPANALPGPTRMRVAMQRDFYADPCETFDYGEVEDYTLNIGAASANGALGAWSLAADEYLHFEARPEHRLVALEWVTNTEFKNKYFVVERSGDGDHFTPLREVRSFSDGRNSMRYEQVDDEPLLGTNYYRLRTVFEDDRWTLSSVRRVQFNEQLAPVSVFPNPASQEVFVHLKDYVGQTAYLQLYNADGELQLEQRLEEIPGHPIKMNIEGLLNGFYTLSIKVDDLKVISKNIIVNRLY